MTGGPVLAPIPVVGAPRRTRSWGWWTATGIVLLPAVIPPLALAAQVIASDVGIAIPFDRLVALFIRTLGLTAAVTVTAVALGTTTAWLTTRTDLPGRRVWMVVAALPLVVPSYMAALTIIGATGPTGVLATWLGVDVPTPYGFVGTWLALGVFLAPMAHLMAIPGLRGIDPATEEAAMGLGASPTRTFFTVTLPQLRPAMISAGLMVSLYTISDFGAVSLLRFDTFTRAIYTLYAGQIDRGPAASLSVVLMVLALGVLLVERRSRRNASYATSATKRRRSPAAMSPAQRTGAIGFLAGYATFSLAIPVGVLVFWLVRGASAGATADSVWGETFTSLGLALLAAAIAVVAAYPVAMTTTWRAGRMSGAVDTSVWAIYSLPHITVGVAVVAFALEYAAALYQTLLLLVLVYAAMFLAQAVSGVQDALRRTSPDLEEASRGLGKNTLRTLARVTLPVTRSGAVAGATLVFISVMKELPATLLLRPNGVETLAVRIWSATGEGFYTTASAASLALLAVSVVPLLAMTNRDLA